MTSFAINGEYCLYFFFCVYHGLKKKKCILFFLRKIKQSYFHVLKCPILAGTLSLLLLLLLVVVVVVVVSLLFIFIFYHVSASKVLF